MRMSQPSTLRSRVFIALLAAYPLFLIGLSMIHTLAPQRYGLLAVSQIFAPYLFLPLLFLLPFIFVRQAWFLRGALVVCALLFFVRFVPLPAASTPSQATGANTIRVLSWNILFYNRASQEEVLVDRPVDVIALQECGPRQARLLQDSTVLAERYPHQIYGLRRPARDMCLLSRFPILDHGNSADPSIQWARLDLGDERTLLFVNTHLSRGRFHLLRRLPIPIGYDPSRRDAQVERLRSTVEDLARTGEPVLLVGDFNMTEREPAYAELSAGLIDSHRAVGTSPGHTWRPRTYWPLGLLRIDYMFANYQVTPLRIHSDCTPRGSDHCIVQGTFNLH